MNRRYNTATASVLLCIATVTAGLAVGAGCRKAPPRPKRPQRPVATPRPQSPTVNRPTAMELVSEYAEKYPDIANMTEARPFYIGDWNGYVRTCEESELAHLKGFSSGDLGNTFVVYRKPFGVNGRGREDFFIIENKNHRVRHHVGLMESDMRNPPSQPE